MNMNRRKAIFSILIIGGGVAASYTGFKVFDIYKTPDFNFLNKSEDLISALAEVIIPKTNTPGALETKSAAIIIQLINISTGRVEQNNFINGLKDVERYCNHKYGKVFNELSENQKYSSMIHFRDEGKNFSGILGKVKNKLVGKSFFRILKNYSTIAFCTSQKGATEALAYDQIPAKLIGCMPMTANQRAWATK